MEQGDKPVVTCKLHFLKSQAHVVSATAPTTIYLSCSCIHLHLLPTREYPQLWRVPHLPCKENGRGEQDSSRGARACGAKSRAWVANAVRPPCDLHSVLQVHHRFSQMSSSREQGVGQCSYSCNVQCPQPLATSSNEPRVVSCGASRVIIYPPPVVVIFPGPIISTCPQETVVKSSPVLAGDAPAPLTSLRAEVPCSEPHAERSIPKDVPQVQTCAPRRSTYVFSSRWIHPCRRPSYRRHQPSESKSKGHAPEKEKPETENTETANEDKDL